MFLNPHQPLNSKQPTEEDLQKAALIYADCQRFNDEQASLDSTHRRLEAKLVLTSDGWSVTAVPQP